MARTADSRIGGRIAPIVSRMPPPGCGRVMRRRGPTVATVGLSPVTALIVRRIHQPPCPGADRSITVDRHSRLARGTAYSRLDVTNLSRRSCTVIGVPRVEAVDRKGVTVGKAEPVPLLRPPTRGGVERIWLPGGGATHFTVTHAEGRPCAPCRPARGYGLRLTLPGMQRAQTGAIVAALLPGPPEALDLKVGRIE